VPVSGAAKRLYAMRSRRVTTVDPTRGVNEDAARELPSLSLEDALQLVHLDAERGSPKFEPAARRWLVRYLSEGTLSMRDVARVTSSLAKRAD
jgi:hypothetical protein